MEANLENKTNHLINEKSPYLLQHAYNPVDWYPWCKEAFKKASKEDKPVFLSIGYSTCHWCHVMAHESFEDEEVAELINQVFVPIKVDREERPDIDNIYMTVCQFMTGRGGWPLTIFMTPDKKPFYAATYIPKKSRYGRAGLMEIIPRIKKLWLEEKDSLFSSAEQITNTLKSLDRWEQGEEPGSEIFTRAYEELESAFDNKYGGFGNAPKFPLPHQLLFLLHYWQKEGCKKALSMVEKTLTMMRTGGIFDQIGGGFHRYSTDREWLVPHFEKMLYDQALLAYTYLEAYQATGKKLYSVTAEEIFEYINRVMFSEEGGFFSAEDADSEGEEGRFYLWEMDEIYDILPESRARKLTDIYSFKEEGNFLNESTGKIDGRNIPHIESSEKASSLLEIIKDIDDERRLLFEKRDQRVHPHKDDKILTDWNGLMIAALAKGFSTLKKEEYLKMAEMSIEFIYSKMFESGFLLHRYRDGEASINGNVDDYAFLVWGLIELYQASFKPIYLKRAEDLTDKLIEYFWDKDTGGFYFTKEGGEELLTRKKEIYDGAIPSGNSVILWNLVRLSHLTGSRKLEQKAYEMSRTFSRQVNDSPSVHTMFLIGYNSLTGPFFDVVIAAPDREKAAEMLEEVRKKYIPRLTIIYHLAETEEDPSIDEISSFIKDYNMVENKTAVYICRDYTCQLPLTDKAQILGGLED